MFFQIFGVEGRSGGTSQIYMCNMHVFADVESGGLRSVAVPDRGFRWCCAAAHSLPNMQKTWRFRVEFW